MTLFDIATGHLVAHPKLRDYANAYYFDGYPKFSAVECPYNYIRFQDDSATVWMHKAAKITLKAADPDFFEKLVDWAIVILDNAKQCRKRKSNSN